jgi:hypothetical protein
MRMQSSFADFLVGQIVKVFGGAFLVISIAKVRPCPQLSSTTIRAQTNRSGLIPATKLPSGMRSQNISSMPHAPPTSYVVPGSTCCT